VEPLGSCQQSCQKCTWLAPRSSCIFKVTKFLNASSGTISWRVTGTKKNGTRIRKNFADRSDAIQEQADLEVEFAGGEEHRRALRTSLNLDQLLDAESAVQLVGGTSLLKLASHYLGLRARCREKGADLDQAIEFFESRYRPETNSITILNAAEEFLRTRQGLSKATSANYRTGLLLLQKTDPNKLVHTFTIADIEAALSKYRNVRSQRSFRPIFSVFFHWALRHHYTLENPCKRRDKLPKDMTQIAMLSLDESKRLLSASLTYSGGVTAAPVAIALFAGLRPSEIADLQPEDIGEKVIRVSGGKLRRKLKRSVPIPPVLARWLKRYPFDGLPAGWTYKLKQLKKATRAAKWVPDIFRHTSISFQIDRDKNEALTAFNCGTSIQMMNMHYRHSVDDEKAVAQFWRLTPEVILADEKAAVELPVQKRAAWPSKAELRKLVWAKPLTHAAREIGVSDVALRKRCVRLQIDLPPRGHWLRIQNGIA
jgi:integrase